MNNDKIDSMLKRYMLEDNGGDIKIDIEKIYDQNKTRSSIGIRRNSKLLFSLGISILMVATLITGMVSALALEGYGIINIKKESIFSQYEITNVYFDGEYYTFKKVIDNIPRYGLLDNEGNLIFDAEWLRIIPISEDRFVVDKGTDRDMDFQTSGIIDKNGNVLFNFEATYIEFLKGIKTGIAYIPEANKYFLIDVDGNELTDKDWDDLYYLNKTTIYGLKDNMQYHLDLNGNVQKEFELTYAEMEIVIDGQKQFLKIYDKEKARELQELVIHFKSSSYEYSDNKEDYSIKITSDKLINIKERYVYGNDIVAYEGYTGKAVQNVYEILLSWYYENK